MGTVFTTVDEIKQQTGWGSNRVYEYAARAVDPLPLRYVNGSTRSGVVLTADLVEWFKRNSVPYSEKG